MPVENLAQFSRELAQSAAIVDSQARLAIARIGAETMRGVVLLTRVDTGRARGSWQLSHGQPRESDPGPDHVDPSGTSTIQKGVSDAQQARVGVDVWVVSNLPYIEKLEELDHMAALTAHRIEESFATIP